MRRSPLKKRKKSLSRLKRTGNPTDRVLDQLARQVVMARDGNRCVRCGSTHYLQWAHIFSRRYKVIRWLPQNAVCFCAACHWDWHQKPVESVQWWIEKYGEDVHQSLRAALKSPGKLDRRLTLSYLEKELDAMKQRAHTL